MNITYTCMYMYIVFKAAKSMSMNEKHSHIEKIYEYASMYPCTQCKQMPLWHCQSCDG